jgi:hypothetical protein
MDPIQEQIKEYERTARRQNPVQYGRTPLWRLKPERISDLKPDES